MRRNFGVGVFALGAMIGSAAAVTMVAMDPAMRRAMRTKAMKMGRRAMRAAGTYFR